MLRLEQLNYLRMVVRFNSIKIAADALHVVPSTVSTALHKMEDELGIPLLVRTYRGIEVTEAAKEIAEKAEHIATSMREIDDIVYKYKKSGSPINEKDNVFNIYLSRGYYQSSLDQIFAHCEELGIQVECPDVSRGNETYLSIVNEDENAVLINFFVEPFSGLLQEYPNVSYIRINTSRPAVVCSKNYPLIPSNKTELTIEEVLQLPHSMFTEGYDLAFPIYEMLEQYGKVNIVSKYSNVMVQTAMLALLKSVSVGSENGMLRTITGNLDHNMRVLPIRCDMKISLLACYNKKMVLGELIFHILQHKLN